MKRNILIRMLCLLLCVSMLLPLGAAATELGETSVNGNGFDGLITNEMAYVDQFYKGPGKSGAAPASYLNDNGMALVRWLNNEKLSGDSRIDSGYLMLDEEVMRRSGKTYLGDGEYEKNSEANWHMFKEFNARFIGPVADYFASGGASLGIAFIEELAFTTKFKWAGKSAYPYYLQLQQVYYEYMTDLQNELQKVDNSIGNIAKGTKSIAEIGSNSIRIVTDVDVLFLHGTGQGEGLVYRIVSVDFKNRTMQVAKMGGIKEQLVSFDDLGKNVETRNKSISYIMSDLDGDVRENLINTLNANVDVLEDGEKVLSGLPYHFLTDTAENTQGSLKKRINDMDGMEPAENTIAISEDMKKVGDIAQKVSAVNSALQAFNSTLDVSLQQRGYMNVLTNMSQHYLDMLCQWYQDVEAYEVPSGYDDVRDDIQYAILAITKDVLDLQAEATQELKDAAAKNKGWGMGFVFNAGKYAETLLDIAEAAGWKGIKKITDLATNISGSDKITAITSGVAAITSIGWSFLTSKFLEFEDKASTIYNLKWSLDELLTNEENGLLLQYAQNRNHETACEIIRALDTMKILKLMGENLIEEYYLCDFYDSLGVDVSSAAHLVLRNEMAQRSNGEKLDASDSFNSVVAVCMDQLTPIENPERFEKSMYQTHTTIVGLYSKIPGLSYDGVAIGTIPDRYTEIHCLTGSESRDEDSRLPIDTYIKSIHNLPTAQSSLFSPRLAVSDKKTMSINQKWLNGEDVQINQYVFLSVYKDVMGYSTYRDVGAQVYSENGIDIFLTGNDYDQYMKLEKEINRLIDTYGDNSTIDWRQWEQEDHSRKEEKQVEKEKDLQERLQWTITTRGWIEAIDMYDPSTDYIELKKNGYYGGKHPTTIYIKP